jgi:glutamate racemase
MMIATQAAPIGIFDSGVGGLSVLRAIQEQLANEDIIYIADQEHVPYGQRPLEEVRLFSQAITQYFLQNKTKLIVVACNTASAAALHYLREKYPEVPFVGMEPAVKPAVEQTKTGVVGVLATPATFQGALYNSVIERFAHDVVVLQDTCPNLVKQIEQGYLNTARTKKILVNALKPMLEKNIDMVVMGCTHYPFVIPLIQKICGPAVRVIDPAPAIARQVERVLREKDLLNTQNDRKFVQFYTSGDPKQLEKLLPSLIGARSLVKKLQWVEDQSKLYEV